MTRPEATHEDAPLDAQAPDPHDERPPLGSWRRLYLLVLGNLLFLILLFTLFTVLFE